MQIILGGRKTGRTSLLISMAAEAESKGEVCYIVCGNRQQAYKIKQKADELGVNIGFPITFNEFETHQYAGKNIHHFLFDNADHFLQSLTPIPIKIITLEKELDDHLY